MYLENHKIQGNGIWVSKGELEQWYNYYTKTSAQLGKEKIEMAMFYAGMADVLSDMIRAIENNENKE